ncbi:MAG TPA: DNA repair protein RecO [Gemmatimonadaceae bacterium]|nr:DNA repair protein RecO [Gemmatimonadaceae bacterium]
MPLLATDAVVLHAFDYLETSRILRLATREAGVQSVIARGARRSRKRFGSALDLFAEGVAHIDVRPGRELQTLSSFDVTRSRVAMAADLDRFTAATMIAELVLRFARDDTHEALYETLTATLDAIGDCEGDASRVAALAGAWALVARLGFAPALDVCAVCHASIPRTLTVRFDRRSGGALCADCGSASAARALPASARETLHAWREGRSTATDLTPEERRAHARLLREFISEHLDDGRPLGAFEVWERATWGAPVPAASPHD